MKKFSFGPIWDHIQKVRMNKGFSYAINLANEYLAKNPENIEAYLQLIDMYYLNGELEKAEKPVDFLLKRNVIVDGYISKGVLYYIKALLLAERTNWQSAKKYIKLALKYEPENVEYQRVLALTEFWGGNKNKGYELLTNIVNTNNRLEAEMLLNLVIMALELDYLDEVKNIVNMYFDKAKSIKYFTKPKSFYDRKFKEFKKLFFNNKVKNNGIKNS